MNGIAKEILSDSTVLDSHELLFRLEDGCKAVGLLANDETLLSFEDDTDWTRGGSETYISSLVLQCVASDSTVIKRKVIGKAYAGMGLGISPEERVIIWQKRAQRLKASGAVVSKVYGVSKGIIYTDFIETLFVDYLRDNDNSTTWEWAAHKLSLLSNILDDLKVYAITLLYDLRTDGREIYIVDFGEDIGAVPGESQDERRCKDILKRELDSCGFKSVAEKIN